MKNILLIIGMLITTHAFSQQVERYWKYEDDMSTIYYERVDTVTNITLATGSYLNDLKHGTWIGYWENGNIQTVINFRNGSRHGVSKSYDRKGRLVIKKRYKSSRLIYSKQIAYY